ncbi:MAG: hypothetical protein MI919_25555, partial [Holophagales bacterium]|nr:hypothetical protein [Holophagales bacterium]
RQTLLVRAETEAVSILEAARQQIREALPGTPVFDARTADDILRASYATRTATTWTATAFAGLAQLLGLVGLYGLVLNTVISRRRELAVRIAVGATPPDLMRWAFDLALRPVVFGLGAGSILVLAAGRLSGPQLSGLEAADPTVLVLTVWVVLLTAVATAAIPARGAARTDPAPLLRAE